MRLFGLLALVSAAALAQELPPQGTYAAKLPDGPAWPDPATLTPYQRLQMEALLGAAHEKKADAEATERYRNLSPEDKKKADDDFRRALMAVPAPR